MGRLSSEGVELCGRSEAFVASLDHHLSLLNHVHELSTGERTLCSIERFEPQQGTSDTLYGSIILLNGMTLIFTILWIPGS